MTPEKKATSKERAAVFLKAIMHLTQVYGIECAGVLKAEDAPVSSVHGGLENYLGFPRVV